MSTNGLTNNSVNVNTIDGLTVLYASQIYENGNPIVVSNLVPYTNAVKLVDLNNQNLQNVNTLSTTNIIYTGLINSISPTILNYIANLSSDAQAQINSILTTLTNVPRLNSQNIFTQDNTFQGTNFTIEGTLYIFRGLVLACPITTSATYNLDFYSDTDPIRFYSQNVLYLTINSSGLTFTTGINGISPTTFSYLSGTSSNIQTQLNNIVSSLSNYIPYVGANSTVDLNSQMILSSAVPIVGPSLINLTYASANYPTFSYLNSNFLTIANAASTYLTQSSAASTYLTQSSAASTYLTQSSAASTYLTQSSAASTYQTLNSPVNAVGSTFDTSVGGNNVIVISRSTGSNFYNDGPMIQFRQTYFPSNAIIATGGISGYQYSSGNFGGGLSMFYCPPSQSTLVRGFSINRDGYVMIGSSTNPAYKLDVDGYINTNAGIVLSGGTTLTNTILGYISTLSSNAQTQITNNLNSINTINTTLTNVPRLNTSNIFTGAVNEFGATLTNGQVIQLTVCNNQNGWIGGSFTSTQNSSTPDRVVIGNLSGYGASIGGHSHNLNAWATLSLIGGNSVGTIQSLTINSNGTTFTGSLNNISPTVFNYIANLSSDAQTQINTINSTISGLPTFGGTNVWTGSNNFTNTAFYFAQINGNTIASNAGDLGIYGSGATNIRFFTNSSQRMILNSSGNLGVGTSSPTRLLDVNGSSKFNGQLDTTSINIGSSTAQENNLVKIDNGSLCGISMGNYNNTSLKYIGVTDATNGLNVTNVNAGFSGIVFGAPADGSNSGTLQFYTHFYGNNSGERMRIDKNGLVGIGKNNPSYNLDVVGTLGVSSNATITGQVYCSQLNSNTMSSTAGNNLSIYSSSTAMNFFVNGGNHHTCSFGTGSSSLFNCPTSYQLQLNSQNSYFATATSHTWYVNNNPIINLVDNPSDLLSFSRLTANPSLNMGNNYLGYVSSTNSFLTGSAVGNMVLRSSTAIRFTVDSGSTELMSCQSNNVVITGNLKGTSAINLMLGSGSNSCGFATANNNSNTVYGTSGFSGGDWRNGNYHVFTNSSNMASNGTTAGLGVWGSASQCGLLALSPQVAWLGMYIAGGSMNMYITNVLGAYLTTGGWVNVSDERCKRDIKPLKTNRSLERVLNVKTYTYKRICKPTEHGELDSKITEKNLVGFIAQEVQSSNPHCLDTWIDKDEKDEERFGINYNDYVVHLVGAVQEQNRVIKSLQADIATLHASLTQVINTLNSLTTNNISS